MIDLKNDRIAYAVLSFGGFLGMGNKLFAVPWRAFELKSYEDTIQIILNVDKEVLKKAEGFDKDRLPLNYEQLYEVYYYYGYQPYWQTSGREQTGLIKETEAERLDRIERERLRQAEVPERRT
jgi:hypothetical protein